MQTPFLSTNRAFRAILTLLVALVATVAARAQNVEPQLKIFDQQADVAAANAFFDELLKADFLAEDEKVVFGADTPKDSLQQQVWWWAAEWLYDQQQYKEAEKYALQALPLFDRHPLGKADCLNTLGCIYVRLGDFKQAAKYSKQCVEIEVKHGDHNRISSSMNTLAGIYMAAYQAKDAEKYILQALEHAEKVDNPGRKAVILGMASEIYHTLGDDQKALPYAEQAYEIEEQLGREPKKMIRLSQKASALIGLHRYQEAEEALRTCIPVLKEVGDYHSAAIDLNKLGMSLLCQERQQEAIPYYKEAADLFSKMGDLYNEIHSHRGLYESYWKLDPDSAKFYLYRFYLLKDSLYTHSTAESLARFNAEFGNDQLQKENESERAAHRRTIIVGILALLFVLATAWYIVRCIQRRHRQHTQALIREIEQLRHRPSEKQAEEAQQPAETRLETSEEPLPETAEDEENRQFLVRVIEVVNDMLSSGSFGVEQVAYELHMSASTFRRRLQSAAGETPKAYISAIQMEKAAELLKDNPDMPIQDVAYQCGFEEKSSFSHTFKRIYGCTPSQFRKQQGEQ